MILTLVVELSILIGMAIYVETWRASMRRQHAQAWERLLAQFQPNWFDGGQSAQFGQNLDKNATPGAGWRGTQAANGLWSMYENAQAMLSMADYADRTGNSVDRVLLSILRSDAIQIRGCVLIALSKETDSQVSESTRINMSHATSIYTDMVARSAELMGTNGKALDPGSADTLCSGTIFNDAPECNSKSVGGQPGRPSLRRTLRQGSDRNMQTKLSPHP
jgi:hypothetical protein